MAETLIPDEAIKQPMHWYARGELAAYVLSNDWVWKLGSGIAAGNSDNTSCASAGGRGRWGGGRGQAEPSDFGPIATAPSVPGRVDHRRGP